MSRCVHADVCDFCDVGPRDCGYFEPQVDREALLALACEIMAKSDDGTLNPDPMRPIATSLDLFGYARRIRKACGVVGQWPA